MSFRAELNILLLSDTTLNTQSEQTKLGSHTASHHTKTVNPYPKAILLGLLSALFFAVTFVLNRSMTSAGGSWIWSAAFRFFFMLPFLVGMVWWYAKHQVLQPVTSKHTDPSLQPDSSVSGLTKVYLAIKAEPVAWLIWSTIGFGVFYAPLTFSASFAPAWLVASTWQFTIIAGLIIAPFIVSKQNSSGNTSFISKKTVLFSGIILAGILLMQLSQASTVSSKDLLYGALPVLVAAFAYPLGNRKTMQLASVKLFQLNTFERVLAMTLASLPFWVVLSVIGIFTATAPSHSQLLQTLVVAVCSGVIATTLFFMATDLVKHNQKKLAGVEATQSGEVIFALVGEVFLLSAHVPNLWACVGIALVVLGMLLHSLKS